jgi:hypothetical protein
MLQIMGAAARRVSERGRPLCPSPGHGCGGAQLPAPYHPARFNPAARAWKARCRVFSPVAVPQEQGVSMMDLRTEAMLVKPLISLGLFFNNQLRDDQRIHYDVSSVR